MPVGVATFFWGDDRVGARSATGEALAMCTLTNDLETVTWVSAE